MKGHVVVVCGYPPTDSVGGGIILIRLLEHLPAQVVSVVANKRVQRQIEASGARILPSLSVGIAPWKTMVPGLRRLSRVVNLACAVRAARVIERLAVGGTILAVPWGGELGSELFVGAYLAHRRSGTRLVIYEMDEWSSSLGPRAGSPARLLEQVFHHRALCSASRVWAVSPDLADKLVERGASNVGVLPGPVDLDLFRWIEPPAPITLPIRILFVGAIYGAQADALTNAARAVDSMHGDAELEIYTATDDVVLIRLGIVGRFVTIRSPVGADEIPQLLATADLLLLPFSFDPEQRSTVTTSFPTKVGEYLASRRPVIVHAPGYSTISRLARQEGWGVVVDRGEVGPLVEAIRSIAFDHSAALALTERAWETAEARHDLQRCREAFCLSLGLCEGESR